ncbi:MAG: ROK family protein [Planctomycetaceae bacterium]
MSKYYLGVDIGGTSTKAGVVTREGRTLAKTRVPSVLHKGREAGLAGLYETLDRIVDESGVGWEQIRGIGVAAPGTMDIPAGVIYHPFNLPGWENLAIRDLVAEHFRKPAVLQNDANAAAYGEYWLGAAHDARSLMFWTLGTGIGGGIVVNGEIVTGAHSHAGECGHIVIQMEGGPTSPFGIHGSVEQYAGAKGLIRRCEAALRAGARSSIREKVESGEELTPVLIADCAIQGDELAERLVVETGRYLAIGSINIIHTINPEMILVGGAMTFGQYETPIGRKFMDVLRQEVRSRTFPIPAERTRIDYARLGSDAGFIGAAGCALKAFG